MLLSFVDEQKRNRDLKTGFQEIFTPNPKKYRFYEK